MKNTIAFAALFVLFTFIFSNKTSAFLPPIDDLNDKIKINIELPTATPTPIVFKKIEPIITIKLIPTLGSKATVTPEPTPTASSANSSAISADKQLGGQATPKESDSEIVPSVTATQDIGNSVEKIEDKTENKVDLKTIFMSITMGLLALIIVIQLFPKKKTE